MFRKIVVPATAIVLVAVTACGAQRDSTTEGECGKAAQTIPAGAVSVGTFSYKLGATGVTTGSGLTATDDAKLTNGHTITGGDPAITASVYAVGKDNTLQTMVRNDTAKQRVVVQWANTCVANLASTSEGDGGNTGGLSGTRSEGTATLYRLPPAK